MGLWKRKGRRGGGIYWSNMATSGRWRWFIEMMSEARDGCLTRKPDTRTSASSDKVTAAARARERELRESLPKEDVDDCRACG